MPTGIILRARFAGEHADARFRFPLPLGIQAAVRLREKASARLQCCEHVHRRLKGAHIIFVSQRRTGNELTRRMYQPLRSGM